MTESPTHDTLQGREELREKVLHLVGTASSTAWFAPLLQWKGPHQ
jgi:hypothetical protein